MSDLVENFDQPGVKKSAADVYLILQPLRIVRADAVARQSAPRGSSVGAMPGGTRDGQLGRSRLGSLPEDDASLDDRARSSIDVEDVTAYQEVVYRPPGENDSECDSDEDPTVLGQEDSGRGLFGAFRRRALTAAEREEKAARFVQRSFRNRQRRRAGPGEDDDDDALGSRDGTNASSSSGRPFPETRARHAELSETAAATRLQSTWRGKRARDEVKDVKALRDFAIGDPSGLDVNVRKKQEARKKVRGGVHGGTLRVVIRHVHFLRGVFLHVRVVGASDLLAMDSNGLSDPYVKVTLVDLDGVPYKRQVHRTPFEFATLDPKWDVSFFMGAADLNLRQTKLKFEVFDYDQWSADDPMGVTEFPLVVFDEDEQAMIRRAAKWRSKKRKEARARARRLEPRAESRVSAQHRRLNTQQLTGETADGRRRAVRVRVAGRRRRERRRGERRDGSRLARAGLDRLTRLERQKRFSEAVAFNSFSTQNRPHRGAERARVQRLVQQGPEDPGAHVNARRGVRFG